MRGFPTAEAAADALTDAIRKNDDKALSAILGSTWHEFAPGSDRDDDEIRAQFLKAWDESHKIVAEGPDKALIGVGTTGFVAPVPIVKQGNEWRFDIEAGKKEMQARLIGRNELAVVQTLLAIVDAQRDYAALDPMKVGVPVYARRLLSSPGRKDGLYWESKPGEPESPLGPLVAKAQPGEIQEYGYYGYRFRLLYSQGPDAPGGAYDYLVKDRMLGGFAVIAWPVTLGRDGGDDLHGQPQQRRLREGSRPRHGAGGGGDQRLQSRQVMGQGGHDAVVRRGALRVPRQMAGLPSGNTLGVQGTPPAP